mmetsp:Transcript_5369/g.12582  ORF Transcript_5369/g.12582 Transcript_5369/m.12582 type:complete len:98 (+) Transcript_5369:214-507(+)
MMLSMVFLRSGTSSPNLPAFAAVRAEVAVVNAPFERPHCFEASSFPGLELEETEAASPEMTTTEVAFLHTSTTEVSTLQLCMLQRCVVKLRALQQRQ